MAFAGVPTLQPFIKSGRLRPLAIGSKQRFVTLPEVPTLHEAGLPGYETPNFFDLLAPAGTETHHRESEHRHRCRYRPARDHPADDRGRSHAGRQHA